MARARPPLPPPPLPPPLPPPPPMPLPPPPARDAAAEVLSVHAVGDRAMMPPPLLHPALPAAAAAITSPPRMAAYAPTATTPLRSPALRVEIASPPPRTPTAAVDAAASHAADHPASVPPPWHILQHCYAHVTTVAGALGLPPTATDPLPGAAAAVGIIRMPPAPPPPATTAAAQQLRPLVAANPGWVPRLASQPSVVLVHAAIARILGLPPEDGGLPPAGWMRPSNVLARGYRRDGSNPEGVRQVAANSHLEWFLGGAWATLAARYDAAYSPAAVVRGPFACGAHAVFSLLTDPNIAIFRALPGGSWLQVAGIALDDHIRARKARAAGAAPPPPASPLAAAALALAARLRAASHPTPSAAAAPALRPSAPVPPPPTLRGSWELPRCDGKVKCAARNDASDAMFLHYCCSLYHSKSFSRRAGLPASHVLNVLTAPPPTPPPTVREAPPPPEQPPPPAWQRPHAPTPQLRLISSRAGLEAALRDARAQLAAQRHAHRSRRGVPTSSASVAPLGGGASLASTASSLQLPPAAPVVPASAATTVLLHGSHRTAVQVSAISANAGRRLVHHIFVHQPHVVDMYRYNAATPSAAAATVDAFHACPLAASSATRGQPSGAAASGAAAAPAAEAAPGVPHRAPRPRPAPMGAITCFSTDLPPYLATLVPAFRELLARHAACPYAVLLAAMCPDHAVPGSSSSGGGGVGEKRRRPGGAVPPPAVRPMEFVTPHAAVFRFVRACLRKVVPAALWGSSATHRTLLSRVQAWVEAGRKDHTLVSELLDGVATSAFDPFGALPPPAAAAGVGVWITWLVLGYVSPLLRAHFYVTHSEATHSRTLYYRKSTWARLMAVGASALVSRLQLRLLPSPPGASARSGAAGGAPPHLAPAALAAAAGAVGAPPRCAPLGVAPVRLSVKPSGMRPIMNLSLRAAATAPGAGPGGVPSTARSINAALSTTHDALVFERSRVAHVAGASVYSLAGVHEALARFIPAVAGGLAGGEGAVLYAVAADIQGAFDSLNQRIAREVASALLPPHVTSYAIRRWASVRVPPWVPPARGKRGAPSSALRVRWHRVAGGEGALPPFLTAATAQAAAQVHGAVLVDNVEYTRLARGAVLHNLACHLHAHVVQLPTGRHYLQAHGIPQGSVLSTLMCNLYLGHLERGVLLPGIARRLAGGDSAGSSGGAAPAAGGVQVPSLIMRLTDDFLCLTYSRDLAAAFAATLHDELERQGLRVNAAKTQSSTPLPLPGGVGTVAATPTVSWCGLLFHTAAGGVTADHARYEGPGGIRDAVTVSLAPSPTAALHRAVRAFLKPKCHAVLLDSRINAAATVAVNVYHMCLVAGAKTVCLLREWRRQRRRAGVPAALPRPFLRALFIGAARHMVALVRSRCRGRGTAWASSVFGGVGGGGGGGGGGGDGGGVGEAGGGARPATWLATVYLGANDAMRLTRVGDASIATVAVARAPPAVVATSEAVCALTDGELFYLAAHGFAACLDRAPPECHAIAGWCRRQATAWPAWAPATTAAGGGAAALPASHLLLPPPPPSALDVTFDGEWVGDVGDISGGGSGGGGGDRPRHPPAVIRDCVAAALQPELSPFLESLHF